LTSYKIIIPARLNSARLKNKMLLAINGIPLILHTYRQACKTTSTKVIVATDSELIQKVLAKEKAENCMTAKTHNSGTDRICEVVEKYQLQEDEIIVNLQGDEPFMPVDVIEQVADNLSANSNFDMASVCLPLSAEDAKNPNIVKTVFAKNKKALYFSRSVIPFNRDMDTRTQYYRHLGIYAYRVSFLKKFVLWQQTTLEKTEKLEQLRALEKGASIHIDIAFSAPLIYGIDTEEDLQNAKKILATRPLHNFCAT
jgi:3-deoxy-manno-octulosonate cytidylyltransferase (CMP-KDO synthetase)